MPHIGLLQVGETLLGYGITGPSVAHACKELSDQKQSLCVLLAILKELRNNREQQSRERSTRNTDDEHSVSSGIHAAAMVAVYGGVLPTTTSDQRYQGLSVRARKAIYRGIAKGKLKFVSDLTEQNLSCLSNCGEITVAEIMNWKSTLTESEAAK